MKDSEAMAFMPRVKLGTTLFDTSAYLMFLHKFILKQNLLQIKSRNSFPLPVKQRLI
jgi:hypothetical protein